MSMSWPSWGYPDFAKDQVEHSGGTATGVEPSKPTKGSFPPPRGDLSRVLRVTHRRVRQPADGRMFQSERAPGGHPRNPRKVRPSPERSGLRRHATRRTARPSHDGEPRLPTPRTTPKKRPGR